MLIRSQNKEILVNIDRITTISKSIDNCIIVTSNPTASPRELLSIGRYSTKENAIKVLDMIEDKYNRLETYKLDECQNPWIWFTFIMPQDSEVQ